MTKVQIAPSILSADFGALNDEIATVEAFADWITVDVMDGVFVPNITIGMGVVKHLKTKLPIECHLMIVEPWKYVEQFVEAGADVVSVHYEATLDRTAETLELIRKAGGKSSLAIKPETTVDEIKEYLDLMDACVVMSIEPGFGGQKFMPMALPKVRQLKELKPDLMVIIDGGMNKETAPLAIEAGVDVLVSGSYIFKSEDREAAIASLRS